MRATGIVEVQFRDGIMPAVDGPLGLLTVKGQGSLALAALNAITQRHGLLSAAPSLDIDEEEAERARAKAKQKGIDVPSLGDFVTLRFPPHVDTAEVARELRQHPLVERAVVVPRAIPAPAVGWAVEAAGVRGRRPTLAGPAPTDPLLGRLDTIAVDPRTDLGHQWYIFRCRINEAWSYATGRGVVLADIDWGYRPTHDDLAGRITQTHNTCTGGSDVTLGPKVRHGTGVLAMAGGASNGTGLVGIAHGAELWAIQACDEDHAKGNPWARGINWVRRMSSGGKRKVALLEVQAESRRSYEQVPCVAAAIKTAIADDVVVVVAAGNGGTDAGVGDDNQPIEKTGSILVGATRYHQTQNRLALFSNHGSHVVLCAPGDSTYDLTASVASDRDYTPSFGGTSGAAAKVAGVAALLLEANPALTHAQVRDILRSTGSALLPSHGFNAGTFLDARAAVAKALELRRPEHTCLSSRRP